MKTGAQKNFGFEPAAPLWSKQSAKRNTMAGLTEAAKRVGAVKAPLAASVLAGL